MLEERQSKWFPIASSRDLPFRHTYHGQILGREFAVWRADDGYVNVWENRCLHRGVRLSIGINDGAELKCQYHGWRYSNRTAGCTYIPAHPANAPARTVCNRTFASEERYGLVWSGEAPVGELPTIPELEAGEPFALRPLPVNATADLVTEYLQGYQFQPIGAVDGDGADVKVESTDDCRVTLSATAGSASSKLVLFAQPVDSDRTVIRAVLDATPGAADELEVLRHHNERLSKLRIAIEEAAAQEAAPERIQPAIHRIDEELASMPDRVAAEHVATLRVKVQRKWDCADGVAGFELAALEGQLPASQAGSHIDVHLPNGLIRQYSLTNGPSDLETYTIGVKREPDSQGGSKCLHEDVREGDVLAISEPRNNFTLRRDSKKTILLAGGIGITPLLSMAHTLEHMELDYKLHCFAQSDAHLAFADVVEGFGDSAQGHFGLTPDQTREQMFKHIGSHEFGKHLYICGPGPMLEAARQVAHELGWPDEAVHFEYFKNTNEISSDSSFEIDLARSAMTLQVPAGKTILEVMRENGVDVPSSCEQGACGTCLATVLEGEPDHQDVYLNDSEKKAGKCIMTCVSRAKSDRLVLDI